MSLDQNRARRIVRALRSGCVTDVSARAATVGTELIESHLDSEIDTFIRSCGPCLVLVQGDWGAGKSHLRALCRDAVLQKHIPLIEEQVDGKGASLAHINRAISRWFNNIQIRGDRGVVTALKHNHLNRNENLRFCHTRSDAFSRGMQLALAGVTDGWLTAIGYQYGSPEYPYQHVKALGLLLAAGECFYTIGLHGLVLLLDEVENVSREWDIRGRRKCYDTLSLFASDPRLFTILFVTELFLWQLAKDRDRGRSEGWNGWTPGSRFFLENAFQLEIIRPPVLDENLGRDLLRKIVALYSCAYPETHTQLPYGRLLKRWASTPTRSTRLLIRQSIDYLDVRSSTS